MTSKVSHRFLRRIPKPVRRWLGIFFVLAISLVLIRLFPKPPLSHAVPSSLSIYDSQHRLLRLTLASDDQYRLWVPLKDISAKLVAAVLLHEDRYFYYHFGVNPISLVRGAWRTYITTEPRQGGSTITMQLARLKYRLYTRNLTGKLQQIAYALWLELCYSKDELLEAYLNLVPYGQNIEGVGAASLIYFHRPPQQLSLPEVLTLAVIPQSPTKRALGQDKLPATQAARERLFAQWLTHYPEDADQAGLIRLPLKLHTLAELPFHAPHLAAQLIATNHHERQINSTLDLRLQQVLLRQIKQYVERNKRIGIHNAVAMLVDYRDMSVKATVGSADFFSEDIDGQVNGSLAKRSPGSALKPFIYALALDQGVLHPATVLKDAPTAFGPFTPENFDGHFVGPITAQDALIRSRNVPAVAVSAKLSQPSFYQFLKSAGVQKMASEKYYGLALALGGGEATMEELVTLYAMLANRGVLRPLRYRQTQPASPDGLRLLSEEASFITLEMLKDNPRPDRAYSGAASRMPVAWKTGTSWGFRDAWTVGVFGPYVLAVWVGNFNGESNPVLVGIQTAAPLFFQIVDAIKTQQPELAWPATRIPLHVQRVEVCAASGDLPNSYCPLRTHTWFIPGKSPIKVSTIHRPVMIETRTGRVACPPYDQATSKVEVFEFWPSDLARLFRQAGMPRRTPPPLPDCASDVLLEGSAPNITSPSRGAVYALRDESKQSIALQATADASTHELFWFANESFIGKTRPAIGLAWLPQPGNYLVRVVDEHGRSDAREIQVVTR